MYVSVREGKREYPASPSMDPRILDFCESCYAWFKEVSSDTREKLEIPLHMREMLVQYKHEQQPFKSFLYEAALRGPGQELASMSSVLVLICLLLHIIYQGILCSPQWARHGKLKALSCPFLALTSGEGKLVWNSFSSVGSITGTLLWLIFNHNRLIVGSGISFQKLWHSWRE